MSLRSQFADLLPRYVAGIIVAFAVSMTTMFLLVMLAVSLSLTSDGSPILSFVEACLFNALPGFAGVFVGALCLPRPNRVFGSVALLIIGAGFEILFFMSLGKHAGFPRGVIDTAAGGLMAVGLHYWRQRTSSPLAPTPVR